MFSKTGVNALKALAALAALPKGVYAGAGAVARAIGARQNYLGKLLQTLSHEGLVVSQKGLGGGFRLARAPHLIRLIDAIEPIEHLSAHGGCILGRARCSDEEPCALHPRWAGVREAWLGLLRETTIADLAEHHDLAEALARSLTMGEEHLDQLGPAA